MSCCRQELSDWRLGCIYHGKTPGASCMLEVLGQGMSEETDRLTVERNDFAYSHSPG